MTPEEALEKAIESMGYPLPENVQRAEAWVAIARELREQNADAKWVATPPPIVQHSLGCTCIVCQQDWRKDPQARPLGETGAP